MCRSVKKDPLHAGYDLRKSVADDASIFLWKFRAKQKPPLIQKKAHSNAIHAWEVHFFE
jgi:hypothetical protein